MSKWPTERACPLFYGDPILPGTDHVNPKWEASNIVDLTPPYDMAFSWGPKVTKLRFHRKCRDAFGEALLEVKKLYGRQRDIEAHRMHLTGGSFVVRLMRGSNTKLSVHSYGSAIDIDPQHNPFPKRWTPFPAGMAREAAACFEKVGLIWRGANGDIDPMHFQAVERG